MWLKSSEFKTNCWAFFQKLCLTSGLAYGIYSPTHGPTQFKKKGYTSHITPTPKSSPHTGELFSFRHRRVKCLWRLSRRRDSNPPVCAGKQIIPVGLGVGRMASPAGFEPTAPELGILCSIHLSYGDRPRRCYTMVGEGRNLTAAWNRGWTYSAD